MATQNIYSMVDTWNSAGTTFTGIGLNVTDTASASGSLLMDLQVGGSSKFSVNKAGAVVSAAGGAFTGQLLTKLVGGVTTASAAVLLQSDDAGTAGPTLGTYHNSVSPASGDALNRFISWGNNGGAALIRFTQQRSTPTVVTAAAETAKYVWSTVQAGAFSDRLELGAGLFTTTAAAGDKGVGTISATTFYYDGAAAAIMRATNTVTSGAGANLGTLTNSPTAGDPTKWIPFDDAGVTRYIPAW